MSVYIKGLDIDSAKKNGEVIIIYPSGVVMAEGHRLFQAIPVSNHGRLIDADALYKRYRVEERTLDKPYIDYLGILAIETPTIIPGEEGE